MDEHTRRVNEVRSADLLVLQKIKTRNDELERLVSNFELVYLESMASLKATVAERDGLNAARFAYASEFGLDEEGQPDVGSIHQNIRELKAERDQLRAELEKVLVPDGWQLVAAKGFDDLMYWLDRCERKGHLENCCDLVEPWAAFDYREVSIPTPPNADQKGQ